MNDIRLRLSSKAPFLCPRFLPKICAALDGIANLFVGFPASRLGRLGALRKPVTGTES
jgi:hypothetical protein